jgi:K+-transporting ATPase KdpF subunit
METTVYLVGGVVSTLLFVYLMLALLKPEWFA